MVVENLESAIRARTQIRSPYIVFPEDPVIIFCGGNAKRRKTSNPPTIMTLRVEENREVDLMAIIKMRANIVREFASIIPGEPAVHFTALIHTRIQNIKIISPGQANDCCNPKIEKSQT
jgi:hypothetical protein